MMRATTAALVLALFPGTAAASVDAGRDGADARRPARTVFVVSGRGWGHGIGMSQYGALGFALRGWTYDRILAHYYRGTELVRRPATRVRVLLAEGRTSLTVASTTPFTVRDGMGVPHQLAPGTYRFGSGLKLPVDFGLPLPLRGPLVFSPDGAPLALGGRRYRGSLQVSVQRGRLRVINVVGLDGYVAGVVPDEVPPRWPAEALKAQAVAARSYALAVRKRSGPFDVYADTRSQVYGGVGAEEKTTTAAVTATAGQVLEYDGRVAVTYFFSTSGGRTASIADVWDSPPVPYLVSVPDPYDSASPHHSWGPTPITAARLRATLRARAAIVDVRTTVNRSLRVSRVVATTTRGESSISGTAFRTALGLRSTWFRIGVLSLELPQKRTVAFASRVDLHGVARDVRGVTLERRESGRPWASSGRVTADTDGRFSVTVTARAPSAYRLATREVRTGPVRVGVAPSLRLLVPSDPSMLAGVIRPILRGASVVVERRTDVRWSTVARAAVDARGRFEANITLTPGTYRARLAPVRGFAAAVSRPLNIVAP